MCAIYAKMQTNKHVALTQSISDKVCFHCTIHQTCVLHQPEARDVEHQVVPTSHLWSHMCLRRRLARCHLLNVLCACNSPLLWRNRQVVMLSSPCTILHVCQVWLSKTFTYLFKSCPHCQLTAACILMLHSHTQKHGEMYADHTVGTPCTCCCDLLCPIKVTFRQTRMQGHCTEGGSDYLLQPPLLQPWMLRFLHLYLSHVSGCASMC